MSVGLQRLREDADAIRKGAIDKGEDPALVDQAIMADARRRELLGDGDRLKAERKLKAIRPRPTQEQQREQRQDRKKQREMVEIHRADFDRRELERVMVELGTQA